MEDEIINTEIFDVDFAWSIFLDLYSRRYIQGNISVPFYDPDLYCKNLYVKHKTAWDGKLPNNEVMSLDVVVKDRRYVVKWKDKNIHLGSDTILTTFIAYKWKEKSSDMFKNEIKNVKELYCNFGGFAIFPVTFNSFNQVRGRGGLVDRFDLALECIRLYYKNKKDENKLTKQEKGFIERHKDLFTQLFEVVDKDSRKINQEFFDPFVDFKRYVEFFCFQDWVSDDYAHVKDLMRGGFLDDDGNISFEHPFPQSVTEYEQWMKNQLKSVKARTRRINQAITEKNKN